MRAVIQRVTRASVDIDGATRASIGPGMLVLLGIEHEDGSEDTEWLVKKLAALRIYNDPAGVMNLSIRESGGEVLVISQFTLHASTRKGNRPSYIRAARPEIAERLYEQFVSELSSALGGPVATGIFGADMKVSLVNDGPVTLLIDTRQRE